MRYIASLLLLISLLSLDLAVHAEGNCPPGYFPTTPSGTQGPQGCAPIPNYEQEPSQPAGPQWIDRWGAIATDGVNGILGVATGAATKRMAKKAALEDCRTKGGSTCEIQISYVNGCAVMIVGGKGFNVSARATTAEAIQSAMKICTSDGDTECHVYYSACSPPLRVQ